MRNQKKKTACFSAFLDDFFLSGSEFVIPGVVNFIPYVKQPMRLFPRDTTNPLRRKHKNEILSHRFMVHPSKTYLLKTSLPIKNKIITHHVSLIKSSILFRKKKSVLQHFSCNLLSASLCRNDEHPSGQMCSVQQLQMFAYITPT